jgi:hypothetical protein
MDGGAATVWLYRGVMLAFALLTAWPAPCCNNPAFAEIVPPAQRNLIYAFDRCFEGAMAACSAPLVGLLAEDWFGFRGTSKVTGDRQADLHNAQALGNALLAFTTGGRGGWGRAGRLARARSHASAANCRLVFMTGGCPSIHWTCCGLLACWPLPARFPAPIISTTAPPLPPQCPGSSAS